MRDAPQGGVSTGAFLKTGAERMRTNARNRRLRKLSTSIFAATWVASVCSWMPAQEPPLKPPQNHHSFPYPHIRIDIPKILSIRHRKPPSPTASLAKLSRCRRAAVHKCHARRPGRNLPTPGEEAEPGTETGEADIAPGLFERLPHSFRDGAWTWEAIYTGETFTKATGGLSPARATNYRSNLDLVSIIDTERMGWWDGGRLFVYGQNLAGKPLSTNYVGDTQLFSNLDSTIKPPSDRTLQLLPNIVRTLHFRQSIAHQDRQTRRKRRLCIDGSGWRVHSFVIWRSTQRSAAYVSEPGTGHRLFL